MYPLLQHTLEQLKGAFPQSEYSVSFNSDAHPELSGRKAVTLRSPSIAMNNSRMEGIYNIGATSDFYNGTIESRNIHMNVTLAVKTTSTKLSRHIEAMEELDRMLRTTRNVFSPPLCLAFLYSISAPVDDENPLYGYQVGHIHEFHVANVRPTEDGWWAYAKSTKDKAGLDYAPEGIKIDLSVGPFIQYIDTSTGE